jgi:hypothetical protein
LWDYLKAAFWYKPNVPGMGSIPANFLTLIGFAVLGFGNPGFWLVGLGLEVTYLFVLASNSGFQRWVKLQGQMGQQENDDAEWQALARYLTSDSGRRLKGLEQKCKRIIEMQIVAKAEQSVLRANRVALRDLMRVYLKLLVAEQRLYKPEGDHVENSIREEIDALESDLGKDNLAETVRESKQATLNILRKRLRNIERREQYLAETQSNLKRIEAQIDLAVDEAEMQGRPQFISTDIEVAGDLLSDLFYGDAEATIAEMEREPRRKESPLHSPSMKE